MLWLLETKITAGFTPCSTLMFNRFLEESCLLCIIRLYHNAWNHAKLYKIDSHYCKFLYSLVVWSQSTQHWYLDSHNNWEFAWTRIVAAQLAVVAQGRIRKLQMCDLPFESMSWVFDKHKLDQHHRIPTPHLPPQLEKAGCYFKICFSCMLESNLRRNSSVIVDE